MDSTFIVAAIAAAKDMKMLALGMTNDKVEIWDLATRTNIVFNAHSRNRFHHILTRWQRYGTSDASALRLWRAASFEEIADREARMGRWP